ASYSRKIIKRKRTAYGYLLLFEKENESEEVPSYFVQNLWNKDSLYIEQTVTPVRKFPIFSFSLARIR
ncbi:MAG: hypothetical protein LBB84_03135, partial [Tannerellaceae bacterium]|nr:hypothetical protein [Tannerellaceae bacterium]